MKNYRPYMCPVCGKYEFPFRGSFDICLVCEWENDPIQAVEHDEKYCANQMSLNEAKKAYAEGKEIY